MGTSGPGLRTNGGESFCRPSILWAEQSGRDVLGTGFGVDSRGELLLPRLCRGKQDEEC